MAAITGEDFAGALTVSSLLNVTNINTNTGTAGFDVSGYTGKLMVVVKCGVGVSGSVIVPSIKSGKAPIVAGNAGNWVVNGTNFADVAADQIINVDLRSSSWGSTASSINNLMFLTWLITGGSGVANSALEATVIGQKKSST